MRSEHAGNKKKLKYLRKLIYSPYYTLHATLSAILNIALHHGVPIISFDHPCYFLLTIFINFKLFYITVKTDRLVTSWRYHVIVFVVRLFLHEFNGNL